MERKKIRAYGKEGGGFRNTVGNFICLDELCVSIKVPQNKTINYMEPYDCDKSQTSVDNAVTMESRQPVSTTCPYYFS